jgi:ABC-type transporter Mla subunit MlaD
VNLTSKFADHLALSKKSPVIHDIATHRIKMGGAPRHLLPRPSFHIQDDPCDPPTPTSELDSYTTGVNQHYSALNQIVNAIPSESLVMGQFANAANAFVGYFNTIPTSFCINADNQFAFDALNNAINAAAGEIQRGDNIFESNLQNFYSRVSPLLNAVESTSKAINAASRDFTAAMDAANQYDNFMKGIQEDVWNLTAAIGNTWNQIISLSNSASSAFNAAVAQIEANVATEAKKFVDQNTACENAFTYWDTVDGQKGYSNYLSLITNVTQVMIPDFNAFMARVPNTQNIKTSFDEAQQAVNEIDTGFASFPDFKPLPSDAPSFPHTPYGSPDKQYGEDKLITALSVVASAYNSRTGKKLLIGNMQWQHGGYMSPHVSHKNGLDADIVGSDIGIVPNDDAAKALALAKEVLSAGASLLLFADQNVINDANKWATTSGLSGHMSYDASHKDHFHMRMPT